MCGLAIEIGQKGGVKARSILCAQDDWNEGIDLTALSSRISRAYSRRTTFSKISTGKSRRLSRGLPAVIQVGGPGAKLVFAAG